MGSYANEQGLIAKIGLDIIQAINHDDISEIQLLVEQLDRFDGTVQRRGLKSTVTRLETAFVACQKKNTLTAKGACLDIAHRLVELDLKN